MSGSSIHTSRSLAVAASRVTPRGRRRVGLNAWLAERRAALLARRPLARLDWSLVCVAIMSALVGLGALYWSYHNNLILDYQDAQAHMNIARRVLDSRTPGVVQLGTVWLPVPHILLQPFIYSDFLYFTGLAGACVGFLCFEATAILLFLSIRLITRRGLPAWVGLAVFLSNPNAFYIQTTALTEPVLLMSMTASSYFLLRWSRRDSYGDLLTAGLLAGLAVGSRYDGWFFALVCGTVVALIVYLRWRDPRRTEGVTLAYLMFPAYAMFMWFFYNWLIFGDPLEFQRGKYSSAVMQDQAAHAGLLHTKGRLVLSALTYSWDMRDNLGSLILAAAVIGLVVYVITTRLRPDTLVSYTFLSPYPFNIISLVLGQSIIFTPQTNPSSYYNTRYGLLMLPGAAFFIAYFTNFILERMRSRLAAAAMVLAVLGQWALWIPSWPKSAIVVADGIYNTRLQAAHEQSVTAAGEYLRAHYRGGGILIDDTNSSFFHAARIHMREYIATFSGRLWTEALQDPTPYVAWVVMVPGYGSDQVTPALRHSPDFTGHYTVQYQSGGYIMLYRRTS